MRIGGVSRRVGWWLGDWLRYGNARFGERYSRAARITGYDTQTLMNMTYVASRFDVSRRRENLSWSHHAELAALPPGDQDYWLERARTEALSIRDLRLEMRRSPASSAARANARRSRGDPALPTGARSHPPAAGENLMGAE
ncbi:MAG: hypothetical protein M3071_20735 [Actinomycetota bacterium]|nr:hypothetical protein [Actinomycetota bacterium]